ncbi:NADH dehydrogenase [Spirosoma flavus]
MFGLDPLSRPVAIIEILLLLALAAFVGWLLGRLVLSRRISTLRSSVAEKEVELENCRRSKSETASGETYRRPEPVLETPPAYVPADPLLPAFTLDDTPEPIAADEAPTINTLVNVPVVPPPPPVSTPPPVVAPPADAAVKATDSEAAVLNRIASRASEINFDRIGRAVASEADDLKDIVGIGPFLERKLHSLGIYTFRQVGNFTKEDIDKVNEIIEFFPGRIERDNWVEQAKGFYDRKYGGKS